MGKKTKVTSVGRRVTVFREDYRVVGLRRVVDVVLAERGDKHRDAARRAGVTPTRWSRMINADRVSEEDLDLVARGLGLSRKDFRGKLEVVDGAA